MATRVQDIGVVVGEQTTKSCPDCGVQHRLILSTNWAGFRFLSCPNWPRCKYTCDIPKEWKTQGAKQFELF